MKGKGHKQRILDWSLELFNRDGTVAVTTNHISRHLGISPGNLYFHYDSKEHIIRELFQRMVGEVYELWAIESELEPLEFLKRTLELFWKYRFFHREMYHLRRNDDQLSKRWKTHINRSLRLLKLRYGLWLRKGYMRPSSPEELQTLTDCVLLMSNASLGFFESPEKPASRRSLGPALDRVNRMLWPYYTDQYRVHLGS